MIVIFRKFLSLSIILFIAVTCFAQQKTDTITFNLNQAESFFLSNNLQLLTQQYSIDSAKANIITARLYDNPVFSYSNGLYNSATKKLLDLSASNWESSSQLNQLIRTAGKRNKAIQIMQTGAKITEFQFYDLLRALRFTLRDDFFKIYYLQQSSKLYNKEILSLQRTSAAFEEQFQKGNIAKKELIRIKSQLYTLQTELVNLQNNIDDIESEFKLLLRIKADAFIIPLTTLINGKKELIEEITYQSLLDSAYKNRYDLKIAETNIEFNRLNIKLQKSLAVPDITLGLSYDRLGSYIKNFNSIGFSIPLPVFNRNQGNIKQAGAMLESAKLQLAGKKDQLESEVANRYQGAIRAEKLLGSFDPKFESDFDFLIGEVLKNYERRNLTLIEFIDFYEAYKQNVLQLNNLKYNRISQLEQLNYTTGTHLFN